MESCFPTTVLMANGFYKAVIQGHADGHIMDWRGCSYRFLVIGGQPKRGFLTEAEAERFLANLSPEIRQSEVDRAEVSVGTSWNEGRALEARRRVFDALPDDMQGNWAK